MPNLEISSIRTAACDFESALPLAQRKQLGQYFTGIRLGRLLASLAMSPDTRSVLDPMAGHGDLLDAAWETAAARGIMFDRLDGIEVDAATAAMCRRRLTEITINHAPRSSEIICANAFVQPPMERSLHHAYDLVITNPPYVRYQARNTDGKREDGVRAGLSAFIRRQLSGASRDVWKTLAEGYSGLADLSVPAWLLASAMVRPGGLLALVIPATWRSRDYADVIRYLLLRCFSLDYVVEDEQPGWFSDALVRTHLIVARRLPDNEIGINIGSRTEFSEARWIQISQRAASADSLVGAAFGGSEPERQFADWLRVPVPQSIPGITIRSLNLSDEWTALSARIMKRQWFHKLEGGDVRSLFSNPQPIARSSVPEALTDLLPAGVSLSELVTLESAGICVGQGLRTGCNRFFYVSELGPLGVNTAQVEASAFFKSRRFAVPVSALRTVVKRQAEVPCLENGRTLEGRVLDLRGWVLPEDMETVMEARSAYAASGEALPEEMPDELASYVRMAASANAHEDEGDAKIPDLSAVRTNVRQARNRRITPRFWYMLPDFAPRHLPDAFVARINHGVPWVEANAAARYLIDANFSTFWGTDTDWTRFSIKALLNSVWCRAFMEALGTPLGGGALKLEATHLRQMLVPNLSAGEKRELARLGERLTDNTAAVQAEIDFLILGSIARTSTIGASKEFANALRERANNMSCARQRVA